MMTNQEAIASLRTLCNTCKLFPRCAYKKPECFQAIEMAISALQAQDLQPTCNKPATDTISRQAIINSFRYDDDGTAWDMDDIVYRLEQFPSAQPEIVRCKDCRYDHDCNIQYHAQAGDDFYCGAAERRTDEGD